MTTAHRYMARERTPIFDWSGAGWVTVAWLEQGEHFDASDAWLPNGGPVLLIDGRGYVTETTAERPALELVAYNVGPMS